MPILICVLLLRLRERCKVLWWVRLCVCFCAFVCLSAWLSVREDISGTTRAIFANLCACFLCPWLGRPPTGWRNPKGKRQFWGFSSPLTMHCTTYSIWDHAKASKLTEMPFGMISGLGPRNNVLRGVTIPEGAVWGETCPTSLTPHELRIGLVHATVCTRYGQTLHCKRWTSLLSAAKKDGFAHRGRSLISTVACVQLLLVLCV